VVKPDLLKAYGLRLPQSSDPAVELTSLQRQLGSASQILKRLAVQPGVILADDAGLGKTWVAALTALTVARNGGSVLIVVPGKTLQSKWDGDIDKVRAAMPSFSQLRSPRHQCRTDDGWAVSRSSQGGVVIATHAVYASDDFPQMRPDLLIVDEAHRSKHDGSKFKSKLNERAKFYRWTLCLTATPFSIHISELESMLALVSGGRARTGAIKDFSDFILEANKPLPKYTLTVNDAVERWEAAVAQLKKWVMRSTIDQLPEADRKRIFGDRSTWKFDVPAADRDVIVALIRADRLLSLAGHDAGLRGNDPRFHVGWDYLRALLTPEADTHASTEFTTRHASLHHNIAGVGALAQHHADQLRGFLAKRKHQKIATVAKEIAGKVSEKEKVVVFCHHLATARELRDELRCLPDLQTPKQKSRQAKASWKEAWQKILRAVGTDEPTDTELRDAALRFTTDAAFHAQVRDWLDPDLDELNCQELVHALKTTRVRKMRANDGRVPTIAAAVLDIAQWAYHDDEQQLPKALQVHGWHPVILPQSDSVTQNLAIFGTPFGPEVLVATDKFSEGIDLHRYCRIMVHYELDPSPVRVRQREGRVRRVDSWAARIRKPVLYAYPTYSGTRDEALVRIMLERLERFDVLLGGAPAITAVDTELNVTPQAKLLQAIRAELKDRIHTCLNGWSDGK
jgi:hypothetical protein